MDYTRLTIGEMAWLNGITTQTLRHYHREGLLEPSSVDASNGYRYYNIHQCAVLDMIKFLKSLGMDLAAIRKVLSSLDRENYLKLFQYQLGIVEKEWKVLECRRNTLNLAINNVNRYRERLGKKGFFIEHEKERCLFVHETGHDYFREGTAGYELMIRELFECFSPEQVDRASFYNVGTIMRKEYFLSGDFSCSQVFLILSGTCRENDQVEILPENHYLTLYSEVVQDEKKLACELLAEVKSKGYELTGDYLCENILDFSGIGGERRNIFYRIQVPIRMK